MKDLKAMIEDGAPAVAGALEKFRPSDATVEPLGYLHFARKKPSLRRLSFEPMPSAQELSAGWATIQLTELKAAPPAAARVPLTDEQILKTWDDWVGFSDPDNSQIISFARDILAISQEGTPPAAERVQAEPVAWVSAAALASAAVTRERGGPADVHSWSELATTHHCVPLYTAPPAAERVPVDPVAWTDAKLRGIASDYFPDSKDWPAAMLCLRHLLMEQAKYPPAAERVPPTGWMALLKRLEWCVWEYDRFGDGTPQCPECSNEESNGHAEGCQLAAMLAAAPADVPEADCGKTVAERALPDDMVLLPRKLITEAADVCRGRRADDTVERVPMKAAYGVLHEFALKNTASYLALIAAVDASLSQEGYVPASGPAQMAHEECAKACELQADEAAGSGDYVDACHDCARVIRSMLSSEERMKDDPDELAKAAFMKGYEYCVGKDESSKEGGAA